MRTGTFGRASGRHHSYAKKPGYIAVKYKDELFELTNHKAHFRWFGVADAKVQQNLFIVLEPQLFDPRLACGAYTPTRAGTASIFTGNGDKGAASRWPTGEMSSLRRCPRKSARPS